MKFSKSVLFTSPININVKTSPFPKFVTDLAVIELDSLIITDKNKYKLPDINNNKITEYKLSLEDCPDWVSFSSKTKTLIFDAPGVKGTYECFLNWNVKNYDYLGSYFGHPSQNIDFSFFDQRVPITINVVEKYVKGIKVSVKEKVTDYGEFELKFSEPIRTLFG